MNLLGVWFENFDSLIRLASLWELFARDHKEIQSNAQRGPSRAEEFADMCKMVLELGNIPDFDQSRFPLSKQDAVNVAFDVQSSLL